MEQTYYTAKDVAAILKKSTRTIYRDAQNGEIPSVGKRPNIRFPKAAIDALVEIEEEKRKKEKKSELVFSPSTPNDLWQEVNIGIELYGEDDIVPYKTLLKWRGINDEIYMSLKSKNKVVGYSSLMPLDEEVIISLIKDEIRERDIPLDAIKQWSDPDVSVYIASVTIKPTDEPGIDKERAGIIIANTIKWALSLDRQCSIKNWYSIGATRQGQELLEKLGFDETVSLYNGERKGYYLRNIKKSKNLINRIKMKEDLVRAD